MGRGTRGGTLTLTCGGCSGLFTIYASAVRKQNFCSKECVSAAKSADRSCKHCGVLFVTQIGRLSGKTNSSANFCCRECYWASMRKPKADLKGRGGTCQRICSDAIAAAPFCASCGTRVGRLEAHHIVPRRRGGPDASHNLIPLCPPCHKRIESLTRAMEVGGLSASLVSFYMTARLRFRQAQTLHKLRKIAHERAHQIA